MGTMTDQTPGAEAPITTVQTGRFHGLGTSLSQIRVRTRLLILAGVVAALWALVVIFSQSGLSSVKGHYDDANRGVAQLVAFHEAYEAWEQADDVDNIHAALTMLHVPNSNAIQKLIIPLVPADMKVASADLAEVLKYPASPKMVSDIHKAQRLLAQYAPLTTAQNAAVATGNAAGTTRAIFGKITIAKSLADLFGSLQPIVYANLTANGNQIGSTLDSTRNLIWILTVISVLIGALAVWLIIRSITVPLAKLTDAAQRFAIGDVDIDLDVSGRDEIATVAQSFGEAIDNQKQLVSTFERFADGQIGVHVEPRSEVDALSLAFVGMQRKIAAMINEIATSSQILSSASSEMASTSEETGRAISEIATAVNNVASGAEQQVRSVEDAKRVTDELASAARGSAETADETAAAAEEARGLAREGVAAAEQASQAMISVRDSSVQTTAAIKTLGEKSNEIGGIVETITGIAAQTNLLALNAAIEAARAGEHGRGFAVVAEEVRHLAEESQQAAATIGSLIEEIQRETARTVQVVETGAAQTEGGVATVEQARDAFLQIGQSVEDMSARVEEIAATIRQIASGGDQMRETMSSVAAVAESSSASTQQVSASTQQSSASTQEITASAQQLATTAEELERLVSQFVLA